MGVMSVDGTGSGMSCTLWVAAHAAVCVTMPTSAVPVSLHGLQDVIYLLLPPCAPFSPLQGIVTVT
jgi:hypothetical protein